jgi:hypothetical protein
MFHCPKRSASSISLRNGMAGLNGVDVFELVPPETTLDPGREFTPRELKASDVIAEAFC